MAMSEQSQNQDRVTDADIQRIVDENVAGTADLMTVYERAEASYMAAATEPDCSGQVDPGSADSVSEG